MTRAIDVLLVASVALPIVIASAICVRTLRSPSLRLAPWAALPAVIVAFADVDTSTHADSVLLGTRLGVEDVVTRVFLVLTATVWIASGLFARTYMSDDPRRERFWLFFLLSASGNIGLVVAQDVGGFYLFYTLMTFAAYGLVVHQQSHEARRAGKVYLVMGLLGEVLLLAAFVMLVGVDVNIALREAPHAVASSPDRALVVGLLLAGFGIKAGALVLHVWLPVAHPVAPTPASALLSGAMINAGLLGWLRFLPLGLVALPGAGWTCVVGGFGAAFYGVFVGLVQQDPKTILAYSSVSQMGFATAALGIAMVAPATAAMATAAVLFYALHHALVKSALFLGTGVSSAARPGWPHRLAIAGMAVSALDLAGAPLSSGSLAKISLKHLMKDHGAASSILLSAGAVASTMLMAKFLASVNERRGPARPRSGLWAPWLLLLAFDVVLLVWPPVDHGQLGLLVDAENVWSAAWPVLVGTTIVVAARRVARRLQRGSSRIPPGDLLVIFELAHRRLRRLLASRVHAAQRAEARVRARAFVWCAMDQRWGAMVRRMARLEEALSRLALIGVALILAAIALAAVYGLDR